MITLNFHCIHCSLFVKQVQVRFCQETLNVTIDSLALVLVFGGLVCAGEGLAGSPSGDCRHLSRIKGERRRHPPVADTHRGYS